MDERNENIQPAFNASTAEKRTALFMYIAAYIYTLTTGSRWQLWFAAFVVLFVMMVEYLDRGVQRSKESWVWLGCAVLVTACAVLGRSRVWGEFYSIAAVHILAVWWALSRGGKLIEGESGHLLPLDALNGFVRIPFGNFFLRLRCLRFGKCLFCFSFLSFIVLLVLFHFLRFSLVFQKFCHKFCSGSAFQVLYNLITENQSVLIRQKECPQHTASLCPYRKQCISGQGSPSGRLCIIFHKKIQLPGDLFLLEFFASIRGIHTEHLIFFQKISLKFPKDRKYPKIHHGSRLDSGSLHSYRFCHGTDQRQKKYRKNTEKDCHRPSVCSFPCHGFPSFLLRFSRQIPLL